MESKFSIVYATTSNVKKSNPGQSKVEADWDWKSWILGLAGLDSPEPQINDFAYQLYDARSLLSGGVRS